MEVGSLGDWLSALGGLLAVVAAVVAWRVSAKLLTLEQSRDNKASLAARRSQAELVFAVGAALPQRGAQSKWAVYIVNASAKPVYDMIVHTQKLDGSAQNADLKLGAVPPGRFIVPSHQTYHWDTLHDYDRIDEPVELLVKGKGNQMVTCVEFLDATRVPWKLNNGTEIVEASGSALGGR
ncbi:MAG: hypothetical protein ACTHW1_07675 [Ancrocorticia sp.]|uniref:hypothetical protein n=1 Tax=Ancrocorticia sp. TaxID=2593684 RepID=UPI003F922453